MLPSIPVLLKTVGILKLSSCWFKSITKTTSAIMKGFPKATSSNMNGFSKATANSKKYVKDYPRQWLSEVRS